MTNVITKAFNSPLKPTHPSFSSLTQRLSFTPDPFVKQLSLPLCKKRNISPPWRLLLPCPLLLHLHPPPPGGGNGRTTFRFLLPGRVRKKACPRITATPGCLTLIAGDLRTVQRCLLVLTRPVRIVPLDCGMQFNTQLVRAVMVTVPVLQVPLALWMSRSRLFGPRKLVMLSSLRNRALVTQARINLPLARVQSNGGRPDPRHWSLPPLPRPLGRSSSPTRSPRPSPGLPLSVTRSLCLIRLDYPPWPRSNIRIVPPCILVRWQRTLWTY